MNSIADDFSSCSSSSSTAVHVTPASINFRDVAANHADDFISKSITVIEPFFGGSHKQLIDTIFKGLSGIQIYTSTDKKWHWKARTSALYFSQIVQKDISEQSILFTSSVLNLAEFRSLRPDVGNLRTIIYFHENQLCYPVRKNQDRDFQYGYNEILSW